MRSLSYAAVEPDAVEIRVVACLVEKQRTTPDAYPLTLNSLRLACNQATNRNPVVDYDEATVRSALDRLGRRKWSTLASWSTARSVKYKHLFDQALGLDDPQLAVLTVLMLRGAQTAGELRQRTERIHRFESNEALDQTIEQLVGRERVEPLPRRSGERGQRFRHLIGAGEEGELEVVVPPPEVPLATPAGPIGDGLAGRVERLEEELADLRQQVAALRRELGA